MPTNAQAALTAAATVFSGARGYGTAQNVIAVADQLKAWLDKHDADTPPQPDLRETQLDALVIPAAPHGEPRTDRRRAARTRLSRPAARLSATLVRRYYDSCFDMTSHSP